VMGIVIFPTMSNTESSNGEYKSTELVDEYELKQISHETIDLNPNEWVEVTNDSECTGAYNTNRGT
jgi:hypothetical protein